MFLWTFGSQFRGEKTAWKLTDCNSNSSILRLSAFTWIIVHRFMSCFIEKWEFITPEALFLGGVLVGEYVEQLNRQFWRLFRDRENRHPYQFNIAQKCQLKNKKTPQHASQISPVDHIFLWLGWSFLCWQTPLHFPTNWPVFWIGGGVSNPWDCGQHFWIYVRSIEQNSYQSVLAKNAQSSCRGIFAVSWTLCQTKNKPQKNQDLCCLKKPVFFFLQGRRVGSLLVQRVPPRRVEWGCLPFSNFRKFFRSEFWRDMGLHKFPGSPVNQTKWLVFGTLGWSIKKDSRSYLWASRFFGLGLPA